MFGTVLNTRENIPVWNTLIFEKNMTQYAKLKQLPCKATSLEIKNLQTVIQCCLKNVCNHITSVISAG